MMNDEFLVDLPRVVLAAWKRAAPPGGADSLVFPGLDREGLLSWLVREVRPTPAPGSLLLGAGYFRLEKMSIASAPSGEVVQVLAVLGRRLAHEMRVGPDSEGFVPFLGFYERLERAAAAGDFALGYALAPLASHAARRRGSASREAREAIRRAMTS